jgi:hypothetical protein
MGWERRGNRGYYYRKKRIGQRVVSEYVGAGELAELVAELDALRRAEREAERLRWQRERDAELALDQEVNALGDVARMLTQAVMVATGHHTHKGTWRKTRNDR